MSDPLPDAQLAAISAGREAVRERFAGGTFPAALGHEIADSIADAAMAPLLTEIQRLREPIVARWSDELTHHTDGTTVHLVDADDPLRGIALELDVEHREALGLMLVDPDAEMDRADDCSDCGGEVIHRAGCGWTR